MAYEDEKMEHLIQQHGKRFVSGTILFREGDYGDTVFLIHKGKVKISKQVRNNEKTLAILGKGEFFGEMAVTEGKACYSGLKTCLLGQQC